MAEPANAPVQPGSKRWSYFHSALQLAIQRASHKWTYEDFEECFALWCEEQPETASRVFTTISRHMDQSMTQQCEELFKQFDVRKNLDNLHAVVTDARARKQAGYTGKDVWRDDLHPKAAVRARTIPLLEKERDRLLAELQQLDKENLELQNTMQKNVQAREEVEGQVSQLLDLLEEAYTKWTDMPMEDIQTWSLGTAESLNSSRPL
ncbi:hypothetical protein CERSUDRAFT_143706 [Gelatoporia subvermispora B]|uniref:Uncharacterized protein n=1 Tax=Ceriporiopsis subvermispora (strain B) TaxID=914234 RepID=M2Q736_CERS8|nr:hypothetical protein CERSUDRAFT_143706 [Gelatoporia subvermispora B]